MIAVRCANFSRLVRSAIFGCLLSTAAMAGDIDSHLTATYDLARKAGFTHREALLIAKGNWSLDINSSGTALPKKNFPYVNASSSQQLKHDIHDPGKISQYQLRGERFHLLGKNAAESYSNLIQLNRDFHKSTATGDTKLIQLGQYLHAVQDSQFHQTNGEPYNSLYGHAGSGRHGHMADHVDANFAASVRANMHTYDVLEGYRRTNSLPPPPAITKLYNSNNDNKTLSPGEYDAIRTNDGYKHALRLSVATSKAYVDNGNGVELDREQLERNVKSLWTSQKSGADPYNPPTYLDYNSKFKIDYDGADAGALLVDTAPTKLGVKFVPTPGVGVGVVPVPVRVRDPGGPDPSAATSPSAGNNASTITSPSAPASGLQPMPTSTPVLNPPPAQTPTPAPASAPPPASGAGVSPPTQIPGQAQLIPTMSTFGGPKPGGISLSWAAASRMALDVDLDSLHLDRDRLILAGTRNARPSADAALLFTALRAACEPDEPYMSLDADDGKAWSEETDRAGAEMWDRIKGDFGFGKPVSAKAREGLVIRTVSARRDYGKLWSSIAPRYPNLRTRLVFRPAWLKETRFGEIMYVADVLLKELGAGIPAVATAPGVRAGKIAGYQSSDLRGAVRGLVESVGKLPSTASTVRSWRLWFDLAPDAQGQAFVPVSDGTAMLDDEPNYMPRWAGDPTSVKLRSLLEARGLGLSMGPEPKLTRAVASTESSIDISEVWPQMFVRGHDHASRKDIAVADRTLLALADDVNSRISEYAEAYEELRDLAQVFRLYVAAVAIVHKDRKSCDIVESMPLMESERASRTLPDYHPTELAFTVATYTHGGPKGKSVWHYQVSSFNGGVSPRAREFFERETLLPVETAKMRELSGEAAAHKMDAQWRGGQGRQYLALHLDDDMELKRTMRLRAAFQPTTKEMVFAKYPELAKLAGEAVASGMLDTETPPPESRRPVAPADTSNGMLDDVDSTEGRTVVVPAR